MTTALLTQFRSTRLAFYTWRTDLTWTGGLALSLLFAVVTGLAAQIALPLPGTPVPVTGQTFAVLLAGVLLGRRYGGLSQVLYVALGGLGLPWFAGQSGGFGILTGATAGYLVGFIAAAYFLGWMTESKERRTLFPLVGLMWFTSLVLIQGLGLLGLTAWLTATTGQVPELQQVLGLGFLPFVVGDVFKILLAATAARALLPQPH